jgi:hypothetical protein
MGPEGMVSSAEMERMMKVQEVILKEMAGKLKWWRQPRSSVSQTGR